MKDGPVALFHNVPPNLFEYPEHEAWNDPKWAIFMEDDEEYIGCKIKKAFCPAKVAEGNPCLEYIKCIIFPWFGKFEMVRKEGNCSGTFFSMEELTAAYESGVLHPADVKDALEKAINMMLRPINDGLRSNPGGKDLVEAMEQRFYIPW